jgi:hypothetical protein
MAANPLTAEHSAQRESIHNIAMNGKTDDAARKLIHHD